MSRKPSWASHQWFEVIVEDGLSDRLVGKYKTQRRADEVAADCKRALLAARVVEVNRL